MNAEKRLLVSEARLQALIEATSDALYRMSPDWSEMKQLEGGGFLPNTLSEAPNRDWLLAYIPSDDREYVTAHIDAAINEKRTFSLEHRVVQADGGVGWTSSRAVPILDESGAIVEWFGAASDVTARKEAELRLHASKESLQAEVAERKAERDRMWNSSLDLLLIIDFQGVFRDVNPSWSRILGYAVEELIGQHINTFVVPDDHAETIRSYELAASGQGVSVQNRYRHKDGSIRWISWTAAPAGDVTYAIGRDVTGERQQSLDLQAAQDALRQSQKMEAVGQLTGGVAHDFNNLLTVIRGSVDMLRRDTLAPDKRAHFLDAIGETADRAAKLTSQLLAFARRQALNPEVFDVADRIAAISDMLNSVTGNLIQIETRFPADRCFVRADVSQFETALVNMAVNARDAMAQGGCLTITLECRVAMPAIRGHGEAGGPFVSVTLSDTGSGMTPAVLNQIFEPFFTTKDIGKGTGLGLSQVFGFAKQSGGDIDVSSKVGMGSTFVLYLPEAEGDAAPTPRAITKEASSEGRGLCVLVVEDNVEVGQFTTQTLQEFGYRTELVSTGEAALAALGANGTGFDVVFSDIVMPGMGGIELARRLARDMPHMPVVLASGYSHVLAAEGTGEFELLPKPYGTSELSRTLRRVTSNEPE
jgi:PAS domain S-box-containing protein